MNKSVENNKRSITKSVTFRILVIVSDMIIITAVTHSYGVALGVTIATNVGSTILYYLHERVWAKVKWGIASQPSR